MLVVFSPFLHDLYTHINIKLGQSKDFHLVFALMRAYSSHLHANVYQHLTCNQQLISNSH